MIHSQNQKVETIIGPVSIGTTEVTGVLDTLDADYVTIDTILATAATSVTLAIAVAYGDTTSSFTNIAAFTSGTATGNFTAPDGGGTAAGAEQIVRIGIDKRNYPYRYFRVGVTNSSARITAVKADLSRQSNGVTDATSAGAAALVLG
jgi:hypothetical protein